MNFNDRITSNNSSLLPEGDYIAKCIEFFPTTFNGSNSTPACNSAGLKFEIVLRGTIFTPEIHHEVIQKTPLHINWISKIKEIHSALGYDVTSSFEMQWKDMVGKECRCHVVIKRCDDGTRRNYISRFYQKTSLDMPKSMTAEEWHTTEHYKKLRAECVEKYQGKCAVCNMPAEHMHHKNRPGYGNETIDDVVMLCGVHHAIIEHKED